MTADSPLRAPLSLLALAFAGAMSALAGGYWDDAWHTERGRDEFFIAPHIAIYAGITVAGGALAGWALLAARRHGIAAVWQHSPLVLALVSVAATLVSGPIDNAWHAAFGRDAVIWSPPHMLGIAGTLGLGAAILAELAGWPERWARPLVVVAGALVLASAGFATVEYDTDVPQFDEAFYLPVLGLSGGLGLLLIRAATDARWAATVAAVVYTGFIGLVAGFLALVDFPPPALPLLVPAAVVVDLARERRWSPVLAGALFAVALHAAYVAARNWIGDGVFFDAADVAVGGALTLVVATAVFSLAAVTRDSRVAPLRAQSASALAAVLAVAIAAGAAAEARAHDPGQGEDAGTVALRVTAEGERAELRAELPASTCTSTQPVAVVARRAGETIRGPLTKTGCRLDGALAVPGRGRWFVYAEMRRDGRPVESWLPIAAGGERTTHFEAARYAYIPAEASGSLVKVIGGVLLYAAMAALVVATFVLITRSSRDRSTRLSAAGVAR
jgi:hypothetical protein